MLAGRRIASGLMIGVAVAGCARSHTAPSDPIQLLSGQLVVPQAFTNGTPYTANTPFTNSIPLRNEAQGPNGGATSLSESQRVEAVDITSGHVMASAMTDRAGRFALAIRPQTRVLMLQSVVYDRQYQIRGLLALSTHPNSIGGLRLSPGSTVTVMAGALSMKESQGLTYGYGFKGEARPNLAKVLDKLDDATNAAAAARYEQDLLKADSANTLMSGIRLSAQSLADEVSRSPASSPEEIGQQLAGAIAQPLPQSTAPPASPSCPPTPPPKSGIGHGPAIPAPSPGSWFHGCGKRSFTRLLAANNPASKGFPAAATPPESLVDAL